MAVTAHRYNHTFALLLGQTVDLGNLVVILLDDTVGNIFDPAATDLTTLLTHEVAGNGWTEGGEVIDNVTSSIVSVDGGMLDGDDIEKVATGGPIAGVKAYVIADATSGKPLDFVDLGETKTADETVPFAVRFAADGFIKINPSA